jgi:hypothetical protein
VSASVDDYVSEPFSIRLQELRNAENGEQEFTPEGSAMRADTLAKELKEIRTTRSKKLPASWTFTGGHCPAPSRDKWRPQIQPEVVVACRKIRHPRPVVKQSSIPRGRQVEDKKQSLTLRHEARERRIISKCETFR